MNATLPLRSNRSGVGACWRRTHSCAWRLASGALEPASGCANRGSAMHQWHARLACGFDHRAEGARRHLSRIVVGPTLDHDADFDRQITVVARVGQRAQVPPVVELALAGHQELVGWAAAALVLQIGVDG